MMSVQRELLTTNELMLISIVCSMKALLSMMDWKRIIHIHSENTTGIAKQVREKGDVTLFRGQVLCNLPCDLLLKFSIKLIPTITK